MHTVCVHAVEAALVAAKGWGVDDSVRSHMGARNGVKKRKVAYKAGNWGGPNRLQVMQKSIRDPRLTTPYSDQSA